MGKWWPQLGHFISVGMRIILANIGNSATPGPAIGDAAALSDTVFAFVELRALAGDRFEILVETGEVIETALVA